LRAGDTLTVAWHRRPGIVERGIAWPAASPGQLRPRRRHLPI